MAVVLAQSRKTLNGAASRLLRTAKCEQIALERIFHPGCVIEAGRVCREPEKQHAIEMALREKGKGGRQQQRLAVKAGPAHDLPGAAEALAQSQPVAGLSRRQGFDRQAWITSSSAEKNRQRASYFFKEDGSPSVFRPAGGARRPTMPSPPDELLDFEEGVEQRLILAEADAQDLKQRLPHIVFVGQRLHQGHPCGRHQGNARLNQRCAVDQQAR